MLGWIKATKVVSHERNFYWPFWPQNKNKSWATCSAIHVQRIFLTPKCNINTGFRNKIWFWKTFRSQELFYYINWEPPFSWKRFLSVRGCEKLYFKWVMGVTYIDDTFFSRLRFYLQHFHWFYRYIFMAACVRSIDNVNLPLEDCSCFSAIFSWLSRHTDLQYVHYRCSYVLTKFQYCCLKNVQYFH